MLRHYTNNDNNNGNNNDSNNDNNSHLVEMLRHVDHHEVVYSALTVRLPSGRKS